MFYARVSKPPYGPWTELAEWAQEMEKHLKEGESTLDIPPRILFFMPPQQAAVLRHLERLALQ